MRRSFAGDAAAMLEMIKFQHSVFALPFALMGALLAANGLPSLPVLLLIIAACVCARTAAMSFNRWADADLDAGNPRTATRAIPSGVLSRRFALGTTIVASMLFLACTAMLNRLAFALAPVTLAILLGYSYTKRFTSLSHFVLGLALGIAPAGAWVAVRGDVTLVPLLLAGAVLLWTAGFDLIYACQDIDCDRQQGLHSIPARIGARDALALSALAHLGAIGLLAAAGSFAGLGLPYGIGVLAVAALLGAQRFLVTPRDLGHIDAAFFTCNSWVGAVMLVATTCDVFLRG